MGRNRIIAGIVAAAVVAASVVAASVAVWMRPSKLPRPHWHRVGAWPVCCYDDGRRLAASVWRDEGGNARSLHAVDMQTGLTLKVIEPHGTMRFAVALPDGRLLYSHDFSASHLSRLRVWDDLEAVDVIQVSVSREELTALLPGSRGPIRTRCEDLRLLDRGRLRAEFHTEWLAATNHRLVVTEIFLDAATLAEVDRDLRVLPRGDVRGGQPRDHGVDGVEANRRAVLDAGGRPPRWLAEGDLIRCRGAVNARAVVVTGVWRRPDPLGVRRVMGLDVATPVSIWRAGDTAPVIQTTDRSFGRRRRAAVVTLSPDGRTAVFGLEADRPSMAAYPLD